MSLRWSLVVMVAACSKSSCPDADQLAPGSDLQILVERCRADGWSDTVTACLKDANKSEKKESDCLLLLDPEQDAALRKAMAPLSEASLAKEHVEAIAHLRRDFGRLGTACEPVKALLASLVDALDACPRNGEIEIYGMAQEIQRLMAKTPACEDIARRLEEMETSAKRCP